MTSFLITIFKAIFSFLNNEVYLNLIGVIFTAVLSYNAAKYSASKPNKINIKQQQFDKVYLPLYRLLENIPETLSKLQALELQKKISNILDQNYEFVFPQLHSLNTEFKNCLLHDKNFLNPLKSIEHHVHTDYELLKKQLGYPSENFFKIFVRMTFKQKALFIISWVNMIVIFLLMIVPVVQIQTLKMDTVPMFTLLFTEIGAALWIMIKVNNYLNNLSD